MQIIIGQYVPGNSIIHRLDSRAKLLSVFIFVMIVFLANNWMGYLILGLFTVVTILLSKVPIGFIYRGLKPVLWIILFTFLLHIFMTKTGPVLFSIGPLDIYQGGVMQGLFISCRFFFLIAITTLLTLTTTPIEITDGMESLLHPFKKLHFPVHELALMMSISLRFIPTLMQETEKIIKAQSARGAKFTTGTIKERLQSIVPLLIPLFINAFKRAEDLAYAMEARGYRGGEGRTKLRELSWNFKETAVLLLLIVLGIILYIVRT